MGDWGKKSYGPQAYFNSEQEWREYSAKSWARAWKIVEERAKKNPPPEPRGVTFAEAPLWAKKILDGRYADVVADNSDDADDTDDTDDTDEDVESNQETNRVKGDQKAKDAQVDQKAKDSQGNQKAKDSQGDQKTKADR